MPKYNPPIAFRLPKALRLRVEKAADEEGLSTSAWIRRAIEEALKATGPAGDLGEPYS
jgi:hypothetical protein